MHISLTNIHVTKEQKIIIDLGSINTKKISGRILRAGKLQDHNTFDNPSLIRPEIFQGAKLQEGKLELMLPPFSVGCIGVEIILRF